MGGFGQQFGGFQPPQYGGGFGQPFGGGFQQPQYGGGFGFQQPQFGGFQNQGPGNAYARQNPYQPPAPPQVSQQPPPGMEVNPDYRPRGPGLQTMEVRPSDMKFRPIQGAASPEPAPSPYGSTEPYKAIPDSPLNLQLQDLMRRLSENPSSAFGFAERLGGSPQGARPNPATGVMPSEPISDPNERTFSTQALIRSTKDGVSGYYTDGSMSRFVPDERQLGPAIQPNPGFRGNFSGFGDTMRDQGVGFGNPYGGFGAPYGGSPYMGMLGGLGGFFGGNGFQGMNQQAQAQAQAQQAALQNQRQFSQGSFSQNTVYPDGRVVY
jgi:hypothetical protein